MSKYDVEVDGETICIINDRLVEKQGIDDETLEKIKHLHTIQHKLRLQMASVDPEIGAHTLRVFRDVWKQNEFHLQELWGFERDPAYHREWELPHCKCPKMDNEDFYGLEKRWVNANCPYHGTPKEPEQERVTPS